ncbi:MAG: 4Fe-4S dicluster domain-containing protein [Proteobacteria bacterium]|nr:4Fe-4S dicluster domain-containing protein [Pseudomonadota bacterium]MDA0992611.1 4Fe-4S dicluster domain-containing protein [Pseudomonadota bacterium]
MIFFSNKSRPYYLGPYPLERLKRDADIFTMEAELPRRTRPVAVSVAKDGFSAALGKYRRIFHALRDDEPVAVKAPVPDDLHRRMVDIKGSAYFLNASQVGICRLTESCWYEDTSPLKHSHAIVVLAEHCRAPENGTLANSWVEGCVDQAASFRAYEIAISIANHIQLMGFSAVAHDDSSGDVDRDRLAVMSGLCVRSAGKVQNPYLDERFSLAVVTTDYELVTDEPLSARSAAGARNVAYWLGIGGSTSGLERWRQAKRPTHMSKFAMETVDRVDRPTTLIIDAEVPRVPKRASFFERPIHGDLGEKAQRERVRFSFKHPLAMAMTNQIRAMVPHQDGPVAETQSASCTDAAENTRALKSLSYFLGAELTGVCEIPDYAWYSHVDGGKPVECHHKYAVVMLIDQEYDTMEGASGDDFISGAQSMRAYMRGALIAGMMAEHVRALGFSSRPQTNADSEVLQLPLILLAGLGELSRIGELVLNPFVGPRFKSVVLTTDMPLIVDKPIDFGLQEFCSGCRKCARECPCDAITWGDKVMFNGYEMWKLDAERCARYRITNQRGLACGRCMKTCPLNKVVTWDGPIATQVASWLGINARWLKPILIPIATRLDDLLGHGVRNPAKKWWLDLEIVDGICVTPRKGVNERDLDLNRKVDPATQKIAYYNANVMPPPDSYGMPVFPDRKAAIAAAALLETPAEARQRIAAGGATPAHYIPTPPLGNARHPK